jgi:arginine repressor
MFPRLCSGKRAATVSRKLIQFQLTQPTEKEKVIYNLSVNENQPTEDENKENFR